MFLFAGTILIDAAADGFFQQAFLSERLRGWEAFSPEGQQAQKGAPNEA